MLKKFEVQGVHFDIEDDMRKHVTKKIGGLDHYLSGHSRESAHAEVFLKTTQAKNNNRYTCEVTLYLPHQTIVVKETAQTMYTAIDVAEDKMKQQLQVYKNKHDGKLRRHLTARFRRKS